ncbi:MAG: hypothetical protein LLF92_09940 [Planctomycetaceae bacterium]|nr:hypothetical protein [Planctomycetaceae bacterium]
MRTFEECLPLNKTLPKIYSSTPVRLGYFMGYLVTALGFVLIAYLIADEKTDKMGYVIILAILGTPAIVCLCLALNRLYKVFLTPVHITFHSTNLRIGETLRIDLKIGGKTENISALMLEINCQAAIIDENTKKSVDKTLYCDCQNIVNNIKNGSAAFIIPHTPEVEKAVDLQARWILIFTAIGDKTSYFRDEYEFEVYAK